MVHALTQILVVLAASLVAVWLVARLGLPSIVGFLVAGIAIGPKGAALVDDPVLINEMAEIGVVLLLFTIGLKFSVEELRRMRSLVFGAGALQVGLTVALCAGIGVATGASVPRAVFLGMLVAMSSTAILLKLLEDRAETQSPHGRLSVGVAIFQDLCVVPAMLVTPMLAGKGGTFGEASLDLLKSLGVIVGVLVGGRLLLPHYYDVVAKTKSREVFTLATILVVLATAAATGAAGLSLALGALVAGVVLSESAYANQVLSDVVPLRDLLASLFFVSVGMLVDVGSWVSDPLTTIGLTAAVLVLKGGIVWGIGLAFRLKARVAILAGIALSQVGEFSFVLAQVGSRPEAGLMSEANYQLFLSVSVLSMVATPFLLMLSPWIVGRSRAATHAGHEEGDPRRDGHVIVVGYGIAGRNVVSVLQPLDVHVTILELNPRAVRAVHDAGGDAEYGDACSEDVLLHLGIRRARAIVLTALDPVAMRRVVSTARRLSRDVEILVRTHFLSEMDELQRLGATAVVPEEFEASIALSGAVLRKFGASETAIARAAAALRGDDYTLLAETTPQEQRVRTLARVLSAAEITRVEVPAAAAGRTLRALDLRARTGVTVVGVERGETVLANPGGDFALAPGDTLVVLGTPDAVRAVQQTLSSVERDRRSGPAVAEDVSGG
jgi:monovalent cation:H+ antiporter-2, CPA2 family